MMMFRNSMQGFGRCFSNGYGGAWGPWGMIIGLGLTILVISLIFMMVSKKKGHSSDENLLNILKEKFVNGEITEEEYLSKKNTLSK